VLAHRFHNIPHGRTNARDDSRRIQPMRDQAARERAAVFAANSEHIVSS
jgi:hypothetical protein